MYFSEHHTVLETKKKKKRSAWDMLADEHQVLDVRHGVAALVHLLEACAIREELEAPQTGRVKQLMVVTGMVRTIHL